MWRQPNVIGRTRVVTPPALADSTAPLLRCGILFLGILGFEASLWASCYHLSQSDASHGGVRMNEMANTRTRASRQFLPFLAMCGLLTLSGCGFGSASLAAALGGGGGSSPTNAPSTPAGLVILDSKTSPARIRIVLTDAEDDVASVTFFYVLPGEDRTEVRLTKLAQNPVQLPASKDGTATELPWDFAGEVGLPGDSSFRDGITVIARVGTGLSQTVVSSLGNDAPGLQAAAPATEVRGIAAIPFRVSDTSDDLTSVRVEYRVTDPAGPWQLARPAGLDSGEPTPEFAFVGVEAPAAGSSQVFFWDTEYVDAGTPGGPATQLPGLQRVVQLRFTPDDNTATGAPVETASFTVDNNSEPLVTIDEGVILENGDFVRGIPVPYRSTDNERDAVRVVFQWAAEGQPFPDLETTDPNQLAQQLTDSAFRRAKQVCTPYRFASGGRVEVVDSTHLRLPQLANADQAWLVKRGLVDTVVELLRSPSPSQSDALTPLWTTNPLTRPVATLPRDDGMKAWVLDDSGNGTCRVVELEVTTGVVSRTVASNLLGTPSTMTANTVGQRVLVATDQGGQWRLYEVAVGSVVERISGFGGPLRGLSAHGATAAYATAGSEILRLDWFDTSAPASVTVKAGLMEPHGLALAADGKRLYFAERAFAFGRVAVLDLATRSVSSLLPGSPTFLPGPTSLALTADASALMVLSAPIGSPATHRHVQHVKFGFSSAAQPAAILVDATTEHLSTGADNLVLLAAQNGLAAIGGLEQRRSIQAFSGPTHTVTVTQPFTPLPRLTSTWRLQSADPFFDARPTAAASAEGLFLWDSRDVLAGGNVSLRSQSMDTEFGNAITTTGLIRLPELFSFGGASLPATPTAIADVNGDGAMDLLANAGANLNVYFQLSDGLFASTPDRTLSGAAGRIVVGDLNASGRVDIVSAGSTGLKVFFQDSLGAFPSATTLAAGFANGGLAIGDIGNEGLLDVVHDGRVFRQFSAGSFAAPQSVPALSTFLPLAPADFNGDGLVDFVLFGGFAGGVTIAYQDQQGQFSSANLNGVGSVFPVNVLAVDVNGDGRVDVVSAYSDSTVQTSDFLNINLQIATGFAAATRIGGFQNPGITDYLASVSASDLNGDGRMDLGLGKFAPGKTGILLQGATGLFEFRPLGPSLGAVTFADVDGDGRSDLLASTQVALRTSRRGRAAPAVAIGGPNTFDAQAGAVAALDPGGRGFVDLVIASTDSFSDSGLLVGIPQVARGRFESEFVASLSGLNYTRDMIGIDLDGDGETSLVEAWAGGFSNTGGLRLPGQTLLSPTTSRPLSIAAADLDGDGDIDLASANEQSSNLAIYLLDDATGMYAAPVLRGNATVLSNAQSVAAGDVNGDGRMDLVVAYSIGVAVFLQTAGGTYPDLPNQQLLGVSGRVATGDFNGDGRADLACQVNTSTIGIFWQRSNGSLPSSPDRTVVGIGRISASADLDANGLQDLVASDGLAYQVAPGAFAVQAVSFGSSLRRDVLAVDLDSDGDIDLVSANPANVVWRGR